MLRILIAEDHVILRDGLKILLRDQPDIEVVAEASNGKEVRRILTEVEIDLAVLDVNMPEMDGIQTAEYIKENYKGVKIIMLSMLDNEKFVFKSFQAGAMGYILKSTGKEEFINAIKMVASNQPYISHKISAEMIRKLQFATPQEEVMEIDLSKRELEVLALIADGYTNGEIAEKTFTSKRTVETHRKNLIEKTGTKNTASLVKFALVNRILK